MSSFATSALLLLAYAWPSMNVIESFYVRKARNRIGDKRAYQALADARTQPIYHSPTSWQYWTNFTYTVSASKRIAMEVSDDIDRSGRRARAWLSANGYDSDGNRIEREEPPSFSWPYGKRQTSTDIQLLQIRDELMDLNDRL